MPRRGLLTAAVLGLSLLGAVGEAAAHAFGRRYDLPLPLWLYLVGAGAAVAATFLLLARFRAGARGACEPARLRREAVLPGWAVMPIRAASVAAWALIVAAGLLGDQNPFRNIAPTAVWVVWWVGTAYLAAFVGDFWRLLSPWAAIADAAAALTSRPASGRAGLVRYPARLGAWPAVAIFLVFAWLELVSEGRDTPRFVAAGVVLYALLACLGFLFFGRDAWLRGGEAFAVFFGLLGRFAPVRLERADGRWICGVRPYGVGLLSARPVHVSEMAFVLAMLATVTVDGLFETPLWAGLVERLPGSGGAGAVAAAATAALVGGPALFAAVYLGVAAAMVRLAAPRVAGARRHGTLAVARLFVLSLVPIAIAYHLAHYFSFLLLAGQFIIPLASDPFGWRWDLFGTALYRIDIGIVDARFVWYTAVVAIVVGHAAAVWLAHVTASAAFPDRDAARRSQYPLMLLMVGYTMLSLWILAQPIVEPG